MNINIGANIKRLRKAKDITQDELADFLGVSFQAVSKWERGDCYPDITMLPSLANLFDVSLDELIDMDGIRAQTYVPDVFKLAHEYEDDHNYRAAADILRKALKTYPNNYSLLSELALVLSLEYSTTNGKTAAEEAIALCQRVLADCTNEKVRSTTRANLCFLYDGIGEHEKAIDLARTLPHVWESREILLPELLGGQAQIDALRQSASVIISLLSERIDALDSPKGSESKVEKMITLGPQATQNAHKNVAQMMAKILGFLS